MWMSRWNDSLSEVITIKLSRGKTAQWKIKQLHSSSASYLAMLFLLKILVLAIVVCYTSALRAPSSVKTNLPPPSSLFIAPNAAGTKVEIRSLTQVTSSLSQHSFGSHYNWLLSSFPYPTKMISSGVVGGLGDILVQTISCVQNKEPIFIDVKRLLVFTSVSTFYIAPTIHVWFEIIEKLKVPKFLGEGKTAKSVMMILADQTVGATFISAGFFFAFELAQFFVSRAPSKTLLDALLAGYRMNARHLWRTLVVNWYYWPIINFLNFRNVPLEYRLLVSNVAAVFWNMFLSNLANSK